MKNTGKADSVAADFFEGIPEQIPVMDSAEISFIPEDFSEMMMEAVYILDFQKRNFHYVADHGFFLCGHSREDAMNTGYEFFQRVIHPADMPLWVKMHNVILKHLKEPGFPVDMVNYFSCTFRIRNSIQTGNKSSYLMAYQKLKPVYISGQLRYGLCLLSSSVVKEPETLECITKTVWITTLVLLTV
jgi:hypothetical protein